MTARGPFRTPAFIGRVIEGARRSAGSNPGHCCLVTRSGAWKEGRGSAKRVDRVAIVAGADPKGGFHFDVILAAHRSDGRARVWTDDAAVAEAAGIRAADRRGQRGQFQGDEAEGLIVAERLLSARHGDGGGRLRRASLRAGDHVWLCGVASRMRRWTAIPMPMPGCMR